MPDPIVLKRSIIFIASVGSLNGIEDNVRCLHSPCKGSVNTLFSQESSPKSKFPSSNVRSNSNPNSAFSLIVVMVPWRIGIPAS